MALRKLNISLLIGLTLCCFYSAYAQEEPKVSSKNILWRIGSQNNSVYLLGSIHLLKSDNYPLNDIIENAFEDSQILVLEFDLESMMDPEIQRTMLMKGMFSEGQTLEKSIGKDAYKLAKTKTEELGVDIAMFENFKPWFFAMTLTTMKLQLLGFNSQYGLDFYFFMKAKQTGKQIVGLETPEYQLDLFDKMPSHNQELLVYQTLLELDIIEKEIDTILNAWSTGDARELGTMLLKSFKEYPGLYETLVTSRNKNWMSKIESFLEKKENYMILVGAGHLVGKNGLVELLKNKGYSIEQF